MVTTKKNTYLQIEGSFETKAGVFVACPENLKDKYHGCAEYGHIVVKNNKVIDIRQAETWGGHSKNLTLHNKNADELKEQYGNSATIYACSWSSYQACLDEPSYNNEDEDEDEDEENLVIFFEK